MGFLSYGYKALKGSGQAINKVKPTVNKTKLEKKLSETTKAIQKAKGSGAKLSQSIFELKNNMPITFKGNKTKTLSNTTKKRNEESKKMFDKIEGRIKRKFGGGADRGSKKLSAKQMKIASLAGNKKKIDGPDFAKLRSKKT